MPQIRINKYLSESGVCSRRKADELVSNGEVTVNGTVVRELGTKIDPEKDQVVVSGNKVKKVKEFVYYALNKPKGYVSTSSDPMGRKKAIDLLPKDPRVFSVGRLDADSSGLLILTNDGDTAQKIAHPSFNKEKKYVVTARNKGGRAVDEKYIVSRLRQGINLSEGVARADKIGDISTRGDMIRFSIVIHQGWNRQIRRMCAKVGLTVVSLERNSIGSIGLGSLKPGEFKKIDRKDIEKYLLNE